MQSIVSVLCLFCTHTHTHIYIYIYPYIYIYINMFVFRISMITIIKGNTSPGLWVK